VSAASGWEVSIKRALGKIQLHDSFASMVRSSDFIELPVFFRHTEQLTSVPPHHADPFDRMLVAQAQVEHATLVTHDPQFRAYSIDVLWV
jgi:PIN domain nuclease of toxin-antitoxin system